jgi:glycosyltransferase involved in cell wall biosynthesis
MVLFLHNRYRVPGGEERVVEELMWLVRERMGERVELLARDATGAAGGASMAANGAPPAASGAPRAAGRVSVTGRARAAAGLLRGGLDPGEVGDAVRRTGARVVHAHNLNPAFGWRALAAARAAGARVVVHLHQYRLVCAVGVCFTRGEECTRCHGRNTLPGIARNCRGSRAEALAYGAGLALWQRRLAEQADAMIVPSVFARERLRALGAPLPWERVHVLAPPVRALEEEAPATRRAPGGYALMVGRVSPEKGLEVAIEACGLAGIPLVVAGAGLDEGALSTASHRADVSFVGRVDDARLAELRAGAALALVPSRSAETFGLAAAEAMAAGLPVVGSRVGALGELLEERALAPPGDARALAAAIARVRADPGAGARGRERIAALCGPARVAQRLAEVYDGVSA